MDKYYLICSDDGFGVFTDYDKALRAMDYFPNPEWVEFETFESAADFAIDEYNYLCESEGNNGCLYTGQVKIYPNKPVFRRELKKKGGLKGNGYWKR